MPGVFVRIVSAVGRRTNARGLAALIMCHYVEHCIRAIWRYREQHSRPPVAGGADARRSARLVAGSHRLQPPSSVDLNAALGGVILSGHHYWVRRLTESQVAVISAATGIDPTAVRATTLAGYPEIADGLDPTTDPAFQSTPGGRLCGSRFCPHCLAATVCNA